MNEQFEKDAVFYWSVCILRRLRDIGLLTDAEYEKIRDISAKHYGTKLLCV
jgi:hypothetical protein